MNIELCQFQMAKQAMQDLEYIASTEAETHILKIKLLMNENASESQLVDCVYQLQKANNFHLSHLLQVLQESLKCKNELVKFLVKISIEYFC